MFITNRVGYQSSPTACDLAQINRIIEKNLFKRTMSQNAAMSIVRNFSDIFYTVELLLLTFLKSRLQHF